MKLKFTISTILSILPSRGKYIHVIVQPNFTFLLYFAKGSSIYIKQLHICPAPVNGNGRSTFYKELSPESCDNLGGGGADGGKMGEGFRTEGHMYTCG